MKSLIALAGISSLALISLLTQQDMATCLARHSFDTCHHTLNR